MPAKEIDICCIYNLRLIYQISRFILMMVCMFWWTLIKSVNSLNWGSRQLSSPKLCWPLLCACRKRLGRRRTRLWGVSRSWKRNWRGETPTSTTSEGLRRQPRQMRRSSQRRRIRAALTTCLRWTMRPRTGPTTAPSANTSRDGASIASCAMTTSKFSRLYSHQPRHSDGASLTTMSLAGTIALAFAVALSMTLDTCEQISTRHTGHLWGEKRTVSWDEMTYSCRRSSLEIRIPTFSPVKYIARF